MVTTRNLPAIQDLYKGEVALVKQNDLNVLLNQEPKKDWILKHPIAKKKVGDSKVPIDYLPIERVEWLLTSIFVKWHTEIKAVQLIANSVVVTVRLYYLNPVTNELDYQDGVGAAPLQTDEGASATDWTKIKSSAVMIAVPAAESYAVKDAAEKIGKLFGKDLNRADKILYDSLIGKFDKPADTLEARHKELIDLIDQLPEIGLQAMYKDECKKAKDSGKFNLSFVNGMIARVMKEKK
jgi:hypothetical protein